METVMKTAPHFNSNNNDNKNTVLQTYLIITSLPWNWNYNCNQETFGELNSETENAGNFLFFDPNLSFLLKISSFNS